MIHRVPGRILSGDDKVWDLEITDDDFEEESLNCEQESLTESHGSTGIFNIADGTGRKRTCPRAAKKAGKSRSR
jgi:hypothetical protein